MSAPVAAPPAPSRTAKGMTYMLVASLFAAAMVGCIRTVTATIHPFEVTLFRAIFGFLVFTPTFFRYGFEPLKTTRVAMQASRGCVHAAATLLFFLGISLIPLAKVMSILFSAPLFASLMAVAFLGERVRARRIIALIVGFTGVLIIIRPGGGFGLGETVMVASAVLWAFNLTAVKVLSRTESSLTITLYMGIFMMPISLVAAVPVWTWPTLPEFGWLVAVGCVGGLNQFFIAKAYSHADMTAVLPLDFLRLVWVAAVGFAFFNEIPDAWTWIGAVVIFASASYITLRERRLNKDRAGAGRA